VHSVRLKLGVKQREATEFPEFRSCPVGDWGELVNFNLSLLIHPSTSNCCAKSQKTRLRAPMMKRLRSSKLGSTTTLPFFWNYTSLSRAIASEEVQKGLSPLFCQADPFMTFVMIDRYPN
jgi:hypothetical protein